MIGISSPTAASSVPSQRSRVCQARIRPVPAQNAVEAAVCPDGKLEVGGESSRCGTGGRSRSMRIVVTRKISDCPTTQISRITDSRQRWKTTRKTTTVMAVQATIVIVSPNSVPMWVSVLSVGPRCFANQRSTPASASTKPVSLSTLVMSSPSRTTRTPIATKNGTARLPA